MDAPYPGHNDQVPSREKLLLVEAVDLPQAAADPVPGDGIAQLLADRNAQPVAALPVFLNVEDQGGADGPLAPAVEPAEVPVGFEGDGVFHEKISFAESLLV